jgi:hypothetical protein
VALAAGLLEHPEAQTQAAVEELERFPETQHPLGVLVVLVL